jgi:hypothetical protein
LSHADQRSAALRDAGSRLMQIEEPTIHFSIAQGANIVRRELGLPLSPNPAADPLLQTDIVPKSTT